MLHVDRRSLLLAASAVAGTFVLGRPERDGERRARLLLIELNGGNDGLSTLVPREGEAYERARPVLAHRGAKLLPIDGRHALAPHLARVHAHYARGRVAVVEGVGVAHPDRSHFRSLDRWHAADDRGRARGDGWIGRTIEALHPGDAVSPRMAHVGTSLPFALRSRTHPALVFDSPETFRWGLAPVEAPAAPDTCSASLRHVHAVRSAAIAASERVRNALGRHARHVEYPDTLLGRRLADAVALLLADSGVTVASVAHTGYDTHSDQRARHAAQLAELDGALGALLDELAQHSAGRDVVVLAYSEFGRRVAENASGGTDHGAAGVAFLAGASVRGGLHGAPPSLTELDDGDLIATTDYRAVYAAILRDRFGVPPARVIDGAWGELDLFA